MARPKSEDKQNAILSAATQVFAERGIGAPTSAISSAAGIAEGTLFTYFKTKDDLINALYCDIKLDMADAMMAGYPRKSSIRQRMQHVWDHYVAWGVENPQAHRVLKQIEVWGGLTEAAKTSGSAPFVEFQSMAESAVAQRIIQDLPQQFVSATINALAEMTMEFMRKNPDQAETYRSQGFEVLWAGLTAKR